MFFFKYASRAFRSYFTVRPVLQRGKSPAPCENRFYGILRAVVPSDRIESGAFLDHHEKLLTGRGSRYLERIIDEELLPWHDPDLSGPRRMAEAWQGRPEKPRNFTKSLLP